MGSISKKAALALMLTIAASFFIRAEDKLLETSLINNVAPRRDTEGNILDIHDGCLHKFGDRYYLYGTAYGKTDGFGKANFYQCASSPDLVRWKLEGKLLKDPLEGVYYRPYLVFNSKTRKYVMWYNWYPTLWDGKCGVATSDTPQGPFEIQNSDVKVSQPKPGDFCIFADDDDTGYIIYTSIEKDHAVSIEKLNDDYLSSTQENSGFLATGCEATAMFKRQGVYYALFDNCCCFCQQGSGARVYVSSKPMGPYTWKDKLNINRDGKGKPIINAQQTYIAQIPTSAGNSYIWMGDRWTSTPDKIKGHDFQYWAPLEFTEDGAIRPLKRKDEWQIILIK